jgi:hypothetical protein
MSSQHAVNGRGSNLSPQSLFKGGMNWRHNQDATFFCFLDPWLKKFFFFFKGHELSSATSPTPFFLWSALDLIAKLLLHSDHCGNADCQDFCRVVVFDAEFAWNSNTQALAELSSGLSLLNQGSSRFSDLFGKFGWSGHAASFA